MDMPRRDGRAAMPIVCWMRDWIGRAFGVEYCLRPVCRGSVLGIWYGSVERHQSENSGDGQSA